jgi:hypothetical protein
MEIIFRPLPSRHQLAFSPALECDTLTVTANLMGMSPLDIISGKFNWNQLRVRHAATRANRFSKVAVLRDLKPKLILVPRTNGRQDASALMDEMLEAAEAIDSEVINFTHYGFVQDRLPKIEVESVFNKLAEIRNKSAIRVLVWDVDARYLAQTKEIYMTIFNKIQNS